MERVRAPTSALPFCRGTRAWKNGARGTCHRFVVDKSGVSNASLKPELPDLWRKYELDRLPRNDVPGNELTRTRGNGMQRG